MKRKIAILGASRPHLPLYLKAREMGLETYCIAWAEGAYCRDYADHFVNLSITDKERIAEFCLAEKIDGIISNAIEPAVPTMAFVAEKCGFNGISPEAAARATDKKAMRLRIDAAQACPQPRFKLLRKGENAPGFYPCIVKPTDSSCSNGVSKVSCPEEMEAALERAFAVSRSGEILIEEFIDGREVSVESISFHGRHHLLAVTDKETTGAPYFVETAHHQPSTLPEEIQENLRKAVYSVLDAMEIYNGASHAEFKISPEGEIRLIEIGARGGGDCISYNLVQLSTGYDYIKGMIEVALNDFTEPQTVQKAHSGIYFLSEETAGVRDFILEHRNEPWMVEYEINDGELRSLTKSQDRSGCFIYCSEQKITMTWKEKE